MYRFGAAAFVLIYLLILPALFGDSFQEVSGSGLFISSDPTGAEVYLNGVYYGATPLTLSGLPSGRYRVRLRKEGYFERRTRVTVPEKGRLLVNMELEKATGRVSVRVNRAGGSPDSLLLPFNPRIYADGVLMNSYELTLTEGYRSISARAFGWETASETIYISRNSFQTLELTMRPAFYEILGYSVQRPRFNPSNSGNLGRTKFTFSVSGPGHGNITIYNEDGDEVYWQTFAPFTSWEQSVFWDGRGPGGGVLPDGYYYAFIDTESLPWDISAEPVSYSFELEVYIDNSLVIAPVSLSSAATGLLFAPLPDVLPQGSYQIEGSLLFGYPPGSESSWHSLPLALALRYSVLDQLELTAALNASPQRNREVPVTFGGGIKWAILNKPFLGLGLGAAYGWSREKTISSFGFTSGLELFLPVAFKINPLFMIGLSPAIAWRGPNGLPEKAIPDGIVSGGFVFRGGFISAGISARAEYDLGEPSFQRAAIGLELKLYPPPSILVFSLLTGVWIEPQSYGFFGGLGIGAIY